MLMTLLQVVCCQQRPSTSVQKLNIVLNADNTKRVSVSGFTCSYCQHGMLCVLTIISWYNSVLCPGCSFYSNKLQLGKNVCLLPYISWIWNVVAIRCSFQHLFMYKTADTDTCIWCVILAVYCFILKRQRWCHNLIICSKLQQPISTTDETSVILMHATGNTFLKNFLTSL